MFCPIHECPLFQITRASHPFEPDSTLSLVFGHLHFYSTRFNPELSRRDGTAFLLRGLNLCGRMSTNLVSKMICLQNPMLADHGATPESV